MPVEATCNCKAVKVSLNDDELFSKRRGHICHCFNCRKTAGSALATNLNIEQEKVTITGEDNLTCYQDPDTLSGNTVKRYFCKTCGNPIKSETKPASDAGRVIIKMGIFKEIPQPEFECFVDTRLGWVPPQQGVTAFKTKMGGEKADQ